MIRRFYVSPDNQRASNDIMKRFYQYCARYPFNGVLVPASTEVSLEDTANEIEVRIIKNSMNVVLFLYQTTSMTSLTLFCTNRADYNIIRRWAKDKSLIR